HRAIAALTKFTTGENGRDYIRSCFADREIPEAFASENAPGRLRARTPSSVDVEAPVQLLVAK
ncbi:MAG: hypothetical protein WA366_05560, partial [Pseudolabrys sp.]